MGSQQLAISVLGPLAVRNHNGGMVSLGGRLQRITLAALVAAWPEPVSQDQLIDRLWDDSPPRSPSTSLQAYVSRLRSATGPDTIERDHAGYRLAVEGAVIDAVEFESLVQDAAQLPSGDDEQLQSTLRTAVGLWRGSPYGELGYEPSLQAEVARLERVRESAIERLYESLLRDGTISPADIAELERAVDRSPFNESHRAHLARALFQSGKRQLAFEGLDAAERSLRDELGVGIGEELTLVREQMQALDPSLRRDQRVMGKRRSLPAGSNLRIAENSFHGRAEIIDQIRATLAETSVVTLTGAGGVGKTRLAIETAAELATDFDAVWELALLESASVSSAASELVSQIDKASVRIDPTNALADLIGPTPTLVVVDNAEHVLADAGELVTRLSEACPELRVIVTSREPLGIATEEIIRVPSFVDPSVRSVAAKLFAARANEARPGFQLRAGDETVIASIVAQVGGLAAGIEIAAAQLRLLSLAQIEQSIDEVGTAVAGASISGHGSLNEIVAWSVDLLDGPTRVQLEDLAVFGASFDQLRLAALWETDVTAAGQLVESLAEASLVERTASRTDAPYRLLEPVRSHLAQRLEEAGRRSDVERRHLGLVLDLLEDLLPAQHGPGQQSALALTRSWWPDIHVAAKRSAGSADANRVIELGWYWAYLGGRHFDVDELILDAGDPDTVFVRAVKALVGSETGLLSSDEINECAELVKGDRPLAELLVGDALTAIGDFEAADPLLRSAEERFRSQGVDWGEGWALLRRLRVEGMGRGNEPLAADLLAMAQARLNQADDAALVAYSELVKASIARVKGRWGPTLDNSERAIALFDKLEIHRMRQLAAHFRAEAAICSLDAKRSQQLCAQAWGEKPEAGSPAEIMRFTVLRAEHEIWHGDPDLAIAMMRDRLHMANAPLMRQDQALLHAVAIDAAITTGDDEAIRVHLKGANEAWADFRNPWARLRHDFQTARIGLLGSKSDSALNQLAGVIERASSLGECYVTMRAHHAAAMLHVRDHRLEPALERMLIADALTAAVGLKPHPAEASHMPDVRAAIAQVDDSTRLAMEEEAHNVAEPILALGPLS